MMAQDYAVHRVTVKFMQPIREWLSQDESRNVGDREHTKELLFVAPCGEFGKVLLSLHLNRAFGYLKKLPSGKVYEILTHEQQSIDAVIRYCDKGLTPL